MDIQTQRAQRRLIKIQEAMVVLEDWLEDIFREGLATVLLRPPDFWENMAKTMTNFRKREFKIAIVQDQKSLGEI